MISFLEVYQAALGASSPQNLYDQIGEYLSDSNGNLIYDRLGNPIIDSQEINHPFYTPAERLAFEGHFIAANFLQSLGANKKKIAHALAMGGHHKQLEDYISNYRHDKSIINAIAHGYAIMGYHDEVQRFKKLYGASIDRIAHGYALGGHHFWVELYRELYQANTNIIAKGYAEGSFHKQVKTYRKKFAVNLSSVSLGYFHGGHSEYGEKYQKLTKKNKISNEKIANIYRSLGDFEKYDEYSAKCLLANYGEVGRSIIKSMDRLKSGQKNSKNPYWKGSEKKLQMIINAVNTHVKKDGSTDLVLLIENRKSLLYQALNFFRLGNISFFGRLSTKTKSLLKVQEKINSIKTKTS